MVTPGNERITTKSVSGDHSTILGKGSAFIEVIISFSGNQSSVQKKTEAILRRSHLTVKISGQVNPPHFAEICLEVAGVWSPVFDHRFRCYSNWKEDVLTVRRECISVFL
jgi:hypothetical protein